MAFNIGKSKEWQLSDRYTISEPSRDEKQRLIYTKHKGNSYRDNYDNIFNKKKEKHIE